MKTKAINILLIEDDSGHIELIKRAFRPYGDEYNFFVTNSLREAKIELENSSPDLIIADLNLPDGKCIELLSMDSEDLNCPMIVMTSQGDEESAVTAMKAGALDYVVKSKASLDNMPWVTKRSLREWKYIKDHKQAITALKQSEEKYRTIVEEASDAIFIIDTKGRILDINASGTKMLLYSYNEILKLSINDIILMERTEMDNMDFYNIYEGEVIIKECFFRCQDTSTIPVEISFRKLLNGKIIGIARNITLRKLSEIEGRRSREELERFNRLAVGRELRMIDLKKEVNGLLLHLGQNEKYKIHDPDEILME